MEGPPMRLAAAGRDHAVTGQNLFQIQVTKAPRIRQ